jgi:hypothetical protein
MTKRALLIGINYYGSSCQLSGCINDVNNMKAVLDAAGYTQFRVLTDTPGGDAGVQPTKANILAGLQWLVAGAAAGDQLFVHYSGHGTHTYDWSGDEEDRQDEAWCPVDMHTAGLIMDDDLRAVFEACPVRALVVSDCCHSGTILDLRFNYRQTGQYAVAMQQNPRYKAGSALCVCLSGCADNQTSADAWERNERTQRMQSQGALTAKLLAAIGKYGSALTWMKLLKFLWSALREGGYSQIPQLSASQVVNLDSPVGI